ncbi:MAG: adenosylcobyric acid synthase [Aerococcus sp.]|nr:adenosylcobyric acid synthase [Aerococcus sp.]
MTLRICHLYGDLMNTYGDNGNLLMLEYLAKQQTDNVSIELVSLEENFDPERYDLVFFGGGQDFEQTVVAEDLVNKGDGIKQYIESGGVMLAICGGYQLLGHEYAMTNGTTVKGIGAIDYYTTSQNQRLIGDLTIYNERFDQTYYGYENHAGRTYLGKGVTPLGTVIAGYGNNGEDLKEGVMYKNTFCSYFHGPLIVRNPSLGNHLITLALDNQ